MLGKRKKDGSERQMYVSELCTSEVLSNGPYFGIERGLEGVKE